MTLAKPRSRRGVPAPDVRRRRLADGHAHALHVLTPVACRCGVPAHAAAPLPAGCGAVLCPLEEAYFCYGSPTTPPFYLCPSCHEDRESIRWVLRPRTGREGA